MAAEKVSGGMKCKVKSNHIAEINDGKPKTYSHHKEEFKVGDTLLLEYEAAHIKGSLIRDVSLWIGRKKPDSTYYSVKPMESGIGWNIIKAGKGVIIKDEYNSIYVTPDMISLEGLEFGVVDMRRYYKNDWHGIVLDKITSADAPSLQAQIYSLDCRHTQDNLDGFISKIMSFGDG